jgi:hypothetical protein
MYNVHVKVRHYLLDIKLTDNDYLKKFAENIYASVQLEIMHLILQQ